MSNSAVNHVHKTAVMIIVVGLFAVVDDQLYTNVDLRRLYYSLSARKTRHYPAQTRKICKFTAAPYKIPAGYFFMQRRQHALDDTDRSTEFTLKPI